SKGQYIMHTGRRKEPGIEYPHLGAVVAKLCGNEAQPLPGYIHITPGSGGGSFSKQDSAFLGPRYASVSLPDGSPPVNLNRPANLSETADRQRQDVRLKVSERFAQTRRTAQTEAYTQSYDQAERFMRQTAVLDLGRECPKVADRY